MNTLSHSNKNRLLFSCAIAHFALLMVTNSFSAEDTKTAPIANPQENSISPKKSASKNGERSFYQVLDDTLGDFEFDLTNGEVNGLKELAIRSIVTSENVPKSFNKHLELLITEKIMKHGAGARMVECLPCRTQNAQVSNGQVVISTTNQNPTELLRLARANGIKHFLDVAFTYQPKALVISMTILDAEQGSMIWSKTYNSETSRAQAFRNGIDYSQIDSAKKQTEYAPSLQHRLAFNFNYAPNFLKYNPAAGFSYRMMERFNNRKNEIGFEVTYLLENGAVGTVDPTMVTPSGESALYYTIVNFSLMFVKGFNFIGEYENYNKGRHGAWAGLGATFASGTISAFLRGAYEVRMGKMWSISPYLGYRFESTKFVDALAVGTVGGFEFGFQIGVLFGKNSK